MTGKFREIIENWDVKALKEEIRSHGKKDDAYKEEFARKTPQILMRLWNNMEFEEFVEFMSLDVFSYDDRLFFISKISPFLNSLELNQIKVLSEKFNCKEPAVPDESSLNDCISLIDEKIMEIKRNNGFRKGYKPGSNETEIGELLLKVFRRKENSKKEYLLKLLKEHPWGEDNYLTVNLIEDFIIYFDLEWKELLVESLKKKKAGLPLNDTTVLYSPPGCLDYEAEIKFDSRVKKILKEGKDIFNRLSDIISGMNIEIFFEVIWLFYPYPNMTNLFLMTNKVRNELITYPEQSFNRFLMDSIENILTGSNSSSDDLNSLEYAKLDYLFMLLFHRKDPENREYIIKLFENDRLPHKKEFYPGARILERYTAHHINEESYRAVKAFFKKNDLNEFFKTNRKLFYAPWFSQDGPEKQLMAFKLILLLHELAEADSNKKRFECLRKMDNYRMMEHMIIERYAMEPDFVKHYIKSLDMEKWSWTCRIFADEILRQYTHRRTPPGIIKIHNPLGFLYFLKDRENKKTFNFLFLLSQGIILFLYLACLSSIPFKWWLIEEGITFFIYSILLLIIWMGDNCRGSEKKEKIYMAIHHFFIIFWFIMVGGINIYALIRRFYH